MSPYGYKGMDIILVYSCAIRMRHKLTACRKKKSGFIHVLDISDTNNFSSKTKLKKIIPTQVSIWVSLATLWPKPAILQHTPSQIYSE